MAYCGSLVSVSVSAIAQVRGVDGGRIRRPDDRHALVDDELLGVIPGRHLDGGPAGRLAQGVGDRGARSGLGAGADVAPRRGVDEELASALGACRRRRHQDHAGAYQPDGRERAQTTRTRKPDQPHRYPPTFRLTCTRYDVIRATPTPRRPGSRLGRHRRKESVTPAATLHDSASHFALRREPLGRGQPATPGPYGRIDSCCRDVAAFVSYSLCRIRRVFAVSQGEGNGKLLLRSFSDGAAGRVDRPSEPAGRRLA